MGGGPIAVTADADGFPVADIAVFKVSGLVPGAQQLRETRGVVKIKAKRRSPAQAVWTATLGVLLRETDF